MGEPKGGTLSHISKEHDFDEVKFDYPHINFDELKRRTSVAFGASCTRIERLTQGSGHILFLLFFGSLHAPTSPDFVPASPGWSCIARFTQEARSREKMTSELQTMLYIRSRSTIPVPEIYLYDFDPKNKVGRPFMLIQRMPGCTLFKIWSRLSIEHKEAVLTQLAGVLAQLSTLRFDKIGCLQKNGLGPMLNFISGSKGPFVSMYDYCASSLPNQKSGASKYQEIKSELEAYLITHKDKAYLQAPYCLIHPDFDSKNMIFIQDKDGNHPPKLSGVIDWEHAYTGPLYYLYEHPIFIQDPYTENENYAENASLRKYFSSALCEQFPNDSEEAQIARSCLQEKCHILEWYRIRLSWKSGRGLWF